MSDSRTESVLQIREIVKELIKIDGRAAALRYAMDATTELLANPSDSLRRALRTTVFNKFGSLDVPYQGNDFEVVDYELYEIWPDLPMFRGPPVPPAAVENGDFFCVIGAAQTFGRLVRQPWPAKLSKALGLVPLNLSRGGVGPDVFLDPRVIELVRKARFVIVQVMSGRSVGCDEYPGGRRITVGGETTETHRWDVLEEIWNKSRETAIEYVRRWNANYLAIYRQLREAIDRPSLLLWLSAREPGAWSPDLLLERLKWGDFPQLIGAEVYQGLIDLFDEHIEDVAGESTEETTSRITGEPCPYFGQRKELHSQNSYYPTQDDHDRLAAELLPQCRAMLSR